MYHLYLEMELSLHQDSCACYISAMRWTFPPWWQPLREAALCLVYSALSRRGHFADVGNFLQNKQCAARQSERAEYLGPAAATACACGDESYYYFYYFPSAMLLCESESECTGYWQCFDTRLRRNGIWWLAYWKSILSRLHESLNTPWN